MKCHFSFKIFFNCFLVVILFLAGCKTAREHDSTCNQAADQVCSIGVFSGSEEQEKQLYELLSNYGIQIGLEGSVFYDIFVPVSKAQLASGILRTNDLTLDGKVRLYKMPPTHGVR